MSQTCRAISQSCTRVMRPGVGRVRGVIMSKRRNNGASEAKQSYPEGGASEQSQVRGAGVSTSASERARLLTLPHGRVGLAADLVGEGAGRTWCPARDVAEVAVSPTRTSHSSPCDAGLVSSQDCKHEIWTCAREPSHAHGFTRGCVGEAGSRQILHVGWEPRRAPAACQGADASAGSKAEIYF